MAWLIWFFLLSKLGAAGFELGAGGITPHFSGPGDHNYCNQFGHSNIIYNPTYYLRVEGRRDAFTAMVGVDSICSDIQGLFYSYKMYEGRWFTAALMAGGYHFNMNHWITEENTTPANKIKVTPDYTNVGNFYFVPLAALELDFALLHAGRWSLMFNNRACPQSRTQIMMHASPTIPEKFRASLS